MLLIVYCSILIAFITGSNGQTDNLTLATCTTLADTFHKTLYEDLSHDDPTNIYPERIYVDKMAKCINEHPSLTEYLYNISNVRDSKSLFKKVLGVWLTNFKLFKLLMKIYSSSLTGALSDGQDHIIDIILIANRRNSHACLELIRLLIDLGNDIDRTTDRAIDESVCGNTNPTSLMFAAWHNKAQIVEGLIRLGKDHSGLGPTSFGANVSIKTKHNMTALLFASVQGHNDVVKILIDSGAELDVFGALAYKVRTCLPVVGTILYDESDDWCYQDVHEMYSTALMYASYNGHIDVVKSLIKGNASINIVNENGNNAMWYAVKGNHINIIDLLYENGCDINAHIEGHSDTPFILAARRHNVEIVKKLLKYNASTSVLGKYNQTVIQSTGNSEIINLVKNSETTKFSI